MLTALAMRAARGHLRRSAPVRQCASNRTLAQSADVAVVGTGIMGMSVAHTLLSKGAKVGRRPPPPPASPRRCGAKHPPLPLTGPFGRTGPTIGRVPSYHRRRGHD
jgi:hypothetical protein